MKSKSTINRNLKDLREIIDTSGSPIETRMAYAMETAIRWATMETVGWNGMAKELKEQAELLRRELRGYHHSTMIKKYD